MEPIGLRPDFDAKTLRALVEGSTDGPGARRFLALAAIYDGATRTEAAKIGAVTPQTNWAMTFNALGLRGPIDR